MQPAGGKRETAVSNALTSLPLIKQTVETAKRRPTIDDCVKMAWETFHTYFRDRITDLVTQYPADFKTTKGEPFWSGHRKFPEVLRLRRIPLAPNPACAESRWRRVPLAPTNPACSESRL